MSQNPATDNSLEGFMLIRGELITTLDYKDAYVNLDTFLQSIEKPLSEEIKMVDLDILTNRQNFYITLSQTKSTESSDKHEVRNVHQSVEYPMSTTESIQLRPASTASANLPVREPGLQKSGLVSSPNKEQSGASACVTQKNLTGILSPRKRPQCQDKLDDSPPKKKASFEAPLSEIPIPEEERDIKENIDANQPPPMLEDKLKAIKLNKDEAKSNNSDQLFTFCKSQWDVIMKFHDSKIDNRRGKLKGLKPKFEILLSSLRELVYFVIFAKALHLRVIDETGVGIQLPPSVAPEKFKEVSNKLKASGDFSPVCNLKDAREKLDCSLFQIISYLKFSIALVHNILLICYLDKSEALKALSLLEISDWLTDADRAITGPAKDVKSKLDKNEETYKEVEAQSIYITQVYQMLSNCFDDLDAVSKDIGPILENI